MSMLVLIAHFIHLVLKKFIIVPFLIIDNTNDKKQRLYDNALDGAEKCRSTVPLL